MASRALYPIVAVIGIAAASAGAWWYQSRAQGTTALTPQADAARLAGATGTAGAPAAASSAPRAAGVEVARVERARLQDDAQSVGSLRSRQSVMLKPEVAGRVRELGFADGARVRRGQVLVQLDDTLQRAEIRQSMAQVSIAQANFRRNQELVAQSFVTQRVLDESAANLQVAEAQLALSCARWSRMAIVAPFDGVVGIRNVNVGDYVKDGAELVNLEDVSSMYVDFRLPERFQSRLQPRQRVQLQLDAFPGRVFNASVEAIDPLLDVNGRSVGVRAILPNTLGEAAPQGGARPGGGAGAGARPGEGAGGGGGGTGAGSAAAPGKRAAGAGLAAAPAAAAGTRTAGAVPMARPPAGVGGVRAGTGADAPARVAVAVSAGAGGSDPAGCAGVRESAVPVGVSAGVTPTGPAPLRPGMFARVTVVFAVREQALVVPEEAIVPQAGRQFVIKVVAPEELASASPASLPPDTRWVSLRQEVKLGVRQLGKVEIVEGLHDGDTVVVAGQQRLQRDGTQLRVVELGRPAQRGGAGAPAGAASAPAGAASAPFSGASLVSAGN